MTGDPGAPRILPRPVHELGDDEIAALKVGFGDEYADGVLQGERPYPNVVATMVRNPTIASGWWRWNNVLFRQLALDKQLMELAVLRVAVDTGATYEWAQHVRMGGRVGLSDETILAVGDGTAGTHEWTGVQAAVLDATDELVSAHVLSDATWARLAEHLDEQVIMELVYVVGSYTCLAMAFNSFGLQLDDDLAGLPPLPR